MLVLSRKVGESIVIGENMSISVLAVNGEKVKIGVCAPPDVSIVRQELLTRSLSVPTEDLAKDVGIDARPS